MTDNPLSDWTTTKSKVLTELYRKTPQSGYSCDMIIIDDVIAPPPTPEQKAAMLKWHQDHLDSKILSAFRIPESAVKGSVLFNEAELTLDEKLQKTWGRNY